MSGYIKLHRGWRSNPVFKGEFSRADAWVWLIENAAWKPSKTRVKGVTVEIERGELSFSQRFLAQKWGWSKSRVDRFIADLRAEGMIETRSKIGATAGHPAGQGQSIITLCNYDKYQSNDEGERGNDGPQIGATAGQQRGKEEEGKKGKKKEEEGGAHSRTNRADYAFCGRSIRLAPDDLATWQERYHAVPDLIAELGSLDDWLQGQDADKRKRWFHTVSGALNRKHQELLLAKADSSGAEDMW